jgi:hypothetical protein
MLIHACFTLRITDISNKIHGPLTFVITEFDCVLQVFMLSQLQHFLIRYFTGKIYIV